MKAAFPGVAGKLQSLDDIDERVKDEADKAIDQLCAELKEQNNPLQVIKKRRPSLYDEYR